MDLDYTLWRNGNSLMLIDTRLSQAQRDTVLDLQLAVGLDARRAHAQTGADWTGHYLSMQARLGCVFTSLHHTTFDTDENDPRLPWQHLIEALGRALPAAVAPSFAACLARVEPALKAEGDAGQDSPLQWPSVEVRLVLPEAMFSAALSVTGETQPDGLRLMQPLHAAISTSLSLTLGSYAYSRDLLERVKDGLHTLLDGKTQEHRHTLTANPPSETEHE